MHDALANRVGMEYEPLSEGQLVDIKNQVSRNYHTIKTDFFYFVVFQKLVYLNYI